MALAVLLSISVLASTWVALFSFLSVNSAYGTFTDLERKYIPDTEALALDLPDLSQVSRVFTADGVLLAELHDGRNSEPVRIEDVPELVKNAVLAAEDAEFYSHEGVDFAAIASAAFDNITAGTQRGGSTITQQVVKNNFIGAEPTIERKIKEAVVAAELERRYTKDQILEFYVNSVYFGSSAYGIKAASREFFRKPLARLKVAEAATLAVLIRNPSLYDPRRKPEFALERRNDVIDTMVRHGFITAEEGEQAKKTRLKVAKPSDFQGPAEHVVAEVKRQLLNDKEFSFLGSTKEARKQAVFGCPADAESCTGGGGLRIVVTIDLDLQNKANEILQEWLPPSEDPDQLAPTGAIAMVDNATGAVKVMASGLPFDQEQFDLATQGRRNPGSAFKPFGLVAALEAGESLNSYWDSSSPKDIECPYVCSERGNVWRVRNAGGGGGLMRLFDATRQSVNVVYAQVALEVGPDRIVDAAHRMGIKSDLPAVPSVILGTGAVSPLEMASAYSNFATNGVWAPTYLISRIQTSDGEVIYRHQTSHVQTIDAGLISAARKPLELVPTGSGTAPRANIGRPQGGKTGTHQSFLDAWFVGFVPQFSTAVWVGYKEAQIPLTGVTIHGEVYPRVYGGSVPAPIWREFMEYALANVPVQEFPPDGEGMDYFFRVPTTEVPLVVGLSRGAAVKALTDARLAANVVEVDSLEPEDLVLSQSVEAGATVAQRSTITIEVSTGKPPSAKLPDLLGFTLDQALSALAALEEDSGVALTVNVATQEVKKNKDVGRVLSMSPGAGATVSHGATVELVVGEKAQTDEGD